MATLAKTNGALNIATNPNPPTPLSNSNPYGWINNLGGTVADADQINTFSYFFRSVLAFAGFDATLGDFLTALRTLFRTRLSANATFYVATTGNDSTGTGASGSPWATIQHAYNYVAQNIDTCGYNVTINIAAGTYSSGLIATQPCVGGGLVYFNGSSTGSCFVSTTNIPCFAALNSAQFVIQNMTLTTTGTTSGGAIPAGYSLYSTIGGTIQIQGVVFGTAPLAHIFINGFGAIIGSATGSGGSYTISGTSPCHMLVSGQANIFCATVTLTGTFSFTNGFVNVGPASLLQSLTAFNVAGATFTGSSIRYKGDIGSTISVSGSGINYFPGNTAGTTTGVYG